MKQFWELVFDDGKHTMEVIGISGNDERLVHNIWEMQQAGMKVRCQTPDSSIPKDELKVSGYLYESDLYSRLISEYETKTGKRLKRW